MLRALPILFLLAASTTQALTKKEWQESLRQAVPDQLCDPARYGACFDATAPLCREKAHTQLETCLKASDKFVSAELTPLLAGGWSRKMTVCTSDRLRQKLPASKDAPAKCKDLANTRAR